MKRRQTHPAVQISSLDGPADDSYLEAGASVKSIFEGYEDAPDIRLEEVEQTTATHHIESPTILQSGPICPIIKVMTTASTAPAAALGNLHDIHVGSSSG
jgi:hypothetical protein